MGFSFTNPVTGSIHTAQRRPQGRYEGAGTVRGVRCLRRNGLGRRPGVRGAEGTRLQRAPTGAASQGAQSDLSRRVLMGRNAEYTRYNRYKARFYVMAGLDSLRERSSGAAHTTASVSCSEGVDIALFLASFVTALISCHPVKSYLCCVMTSQYRASTI